MRLGAGDLSYRIDVRTGDEIERLAASFNSMARQIEESTVPSKPRSTSARAS